MPTNQQLTDLKNQIKTCIRRNSDRGFVPYSGCNRVCAEMMSIMQIVEDCVKTDDHQQAFEIYIMVLLEAVRLISRADTSSGAAGDVIHNCLYWIDKLCQTADQEIISISRLPKIKLSKIGLMMGISFYNLLSILSMTKSKHSRSLMSFQSLVQCITGKIIRTNCSFLLVSLSA